MQRKDLVRLFEAMDGFLVVKVDSRLLLQIARLWPGFKEDKEMLRVVNS